MRCENNGCCICKIVSIFISIVLAAVAGILSFFGFFEAPAVGLYAALIIASVALLLLIIGLAFAETGTSALRVCLCRNTGFLLTGAVGTVVATLAALVFATGAGAVLTAVLTALAALFFLLLLSAVICFVLCTSEKMCD